jgi:hypothetical protein
MTEAAQKSTISSKAPQGRLRAESRRSCDGMGGASALGMLQGLAGNRAVSSAFGSGRPVPPALREEMESRFGQSFADVRIHDDSSAHASASDLHAKAYTHGHDIVFSANRFAPQTASGKRLLAHELAHVVQQRRGGAAPDVNLHGPHEASARDAADAVMQGRESVAVQGSSSPGISLEEEDAGAMPSMVDKAKRAITDALMRNLGLPPATVRVGGAAIRGMAEQMVQELVGDGRGAILLGRVVTMGPSDVAQLVKGYVIGLVEGMMSPVTDLFGLAVFGERIQNLAKDLALTPFGATGELAGELAVLMGESSTLRKGMGKVWGKVKQDPATALVTFFSLSDVIGEFAEKKAYALGKQGGSAIVAGIEAPWGKQEGKEKEHQPDLLTSPLAWVESKAKAAEDWVLDTPWSQMGSKIGYAVGFVAVQVILFAFTEGIGNAVEQVAAGLGKIGSALGKVSKLVGSAAVKAAELLATVGKGIALVEEAIAVVAGKLLKPLGKFFEPILEPLENFFKSLRRFLRKVFGVVEKEGAQLVDTAAGKAGALADDAAKAVPKAAPPPGKLPEVHGPTAKPKAGGAAGTRREVDEANKVASAGKKSAQPKPKANEPATANDVQGGAKPPAKKSTGAKKKTAGADEGKATSDSKKEVPSKAVPKKPSDKKAAPAQKAGSKAGGPSSATKKPATKSTAPKKSPRINDPHGMRQDTTNFDRRTAGAGGIEDISFLKDPDGRYAVKIKGKLQKGLYRGKGKTPPGKTRAPNYNRSRKFVSNREAGLNAEWENAHLWGPGFGDEAAAGMMKAPRGVNQWYQNEGIEGWARDLRKAADEMPKIAGKAAEVEVEATAIAWDMQGRAWQPKTQVDFLKRAEYRVKLTTPGGETASVRVTIDVAPPPGSKVVISFDPPTAANPADLLRIVKGTKLK